MCLDIFLHTISTIQYYNLFVYLKLSIPVIPVELIDIEIDRFPIITETTCICSHMYCIEPKDTPVGRAGDAVVESSFGLMFPARSQGTCDL
jgi:hypothetical protein